MTSYRLPPAVTVPKGSVNRPGHTLKGWVELTGPPGSGLEPVRLPFYLWHLDLYRGQDRGTIVPGHVRAAGVVGGGPGSKAFHSWAELPIALISRLDQEDIDDGTLMQPVRVEVEANSNHGAAAVSRAVKSPGWAYVAQIVKAVVEAAGVVAHEGPPAGISRPGPAEGWVARPAVEPVPAAPVTDPAWAEEIDALRDELGTALAAFASEAAASAAKLARAAAGLQGDELEARREAR
jgi:hypothetical protein